MKDPHAMSSPALSNCIPVSRVCIKWNLNEEHLLGNKETLNPCRDEPLAFMFYFIIIMLPIIKCATLRIVRLLSMKENAH